MGKSLSEHISLVTEAASLATRECTVLIRLLELSDDQVGLRNILPRLIASILEICGISHSLEVVFNNLTQLSHSRPHLTQHWVSDFYYLRTCASILRKVRDGARVALGLEVTSQDDSDDDDSTSRPAPINGGGQPPGAVPLSPESTKVILLDLARVKGRLRTGYMSLDVYSLHCAVSQHESVVEVTSSNGSPSFTSCSSPSSGGTSPTTRSTHLIESSLSLSSTKVHLGHLNHPVENRYPSTPLDGISKELARNKTNPAYPRAAAAWVSPLINSEWDAVREPVLSLFNVLPGQPVRANFVQWVLELSRQTWPSYFDPRHSGQPLDPLSPHLLQTPALASLFVGAAFGLSELCREFTSKPMEDMSTLPWSIVLYSALLGPSALLKSSALTTWERINESPHSIDQVDTVRVILRAALSSPDHRFVDDASQPTPLDYLAFLVSLRLRRADLFFEVLNICTRPSGQLKDLLQPGPFWAVASSRYEPCAPGKGRDFLAEMLSQIVVRFFPAAEETSPFTDLFEGAMRLALDLDLLFTSLDPEQRRAAIPDSGFAEEVRISIREANPLAIRFLIQDPRWDPNLSYEEDSSDDGSYGGTILHMAAENSTADDIEILELIVQSEADIERTDKRNRTALMLCEEPEPFSLLVRAGANTMQCDIEGRNCWHFAAANGDAEGLVWLSREDPEVDQNLRVVNHKGHTPLVEAVFSADRAPSTLSAINSILFLCSISKGDPTCLQPPDRLLHTAVQWGSEQVITELLRLGLDPNIPASDGSSPLHHLNLSASPGIIRLLFKICAGMPIRRASDQKTPLEAMLLNYDPRRPPPQPPSQGQGQPANPAINSDAVVALLTPEVLESKDDRGRGLWERFCCDIVAKWDLKKDFPHTFLVLQIVVQQVACKTLRRYEEESGKSGIRMFYHSSQRPGDAWPTAVLTSIYRVLLSETTCRDRFVREPEALELAGTGVMSNAVPFLDLLLKNKVSVHQRPINNRGPKRTLLELACAPGNRTTMTTFEKLLEYADRDRLNDVDDTQQGLIHHLIVPGPGRDQKLAALLDKGADPNLMRWGRSPALTSYILDRQHDAAIILLEKGANPALITKDGMDAALAAASRGTLRILEKIKHLAPPDFNWQRTCKSHFTIIHPGGAQITTTASNCNALHLAAFNGYDIIVQFYCLNFKIDVNHAIVDNLNRPIHHAAIGGSASCIRVLHEHGADLKARATDGSTALHTAVRSSQVPAVKALLELSHGSLSTIGDNEMLTPFIHALHIGFPSVTRLFTDIATLKLEPDATAKASAARSRFIGQTIETAIRSGDLVQCRNLFAVTSLEDFETCPLRCEGCTPVMLAIREGKLAVLKWLLEQKCTGFIGLCPTHFRRHFQMGFNALNVLCENPRLNEGLAPLLSAYLQNGIDWTSASISPIHAAAKANNLAAIKIILEHIQRNSTTYRQKFCFEVSSPRRTSEQVSSDTVGHMVRYILNQEVTMTDAFDLYRGWTPLHISTSHGHDDITLFLIENGAHIDAEDDGYNTPLHIAVKNGHNDGVQILLKHGAHTTRAHGQGFAPLMAAVEAGNVPMVEAFVGAKAETRIVDMDGMSLLNIAGERPKNPAVFHYLMDLGRLGHPGLNPYARDKARYMAYDDMMLNFDMLGYVLNLTFDFDKMEELSKGLFALVIELNRNDSVMMLKRLLRRLPGDKVAKMVNSVPDRFVSPLCAAVHRDIFGAIDLLVRHGADVDLEGSSEGTPLLTACSRGRLEAVRMLVGHGASVRYERDGKVRSGVVAAERFPEIQRWLLVERYAERKALGSGDPSRDPEEVRHWSGIWSAAHRLQGTFAERRRGPKESRIEWLERAAELRRSFAGKVARGLEIVRAANGEVEVPEVSVWDVEKKRVRVRR